jgi:tetratricopeptide (TPR) repeat protein
MKAKLFIFLLGLGLSFSAVAATLPVNNFVPQDNFGPKYGKDSVKCLMNLSLYTESFRQWRQSHYKNSAVNDAINPWNWVFNNCPRSTEAIYVDGAKILRYRIQHASSVDKKKQLIDTLMLLFDKRIKYFPNNYRTHLPQEGYVLGRKGVALYQLSPESYDKAYTILKKAVELDKTRTSAAVLAYYFRDVAKMTQSGKLDTLALIDTYDTVSGYLDQDIKMFEAQNNSRKVTEYKNVKGYVEMTFEPFANCKILSRVFRKKFEATPNDSVLLRKIVNLLEQKNCYDQPLYFDASVNLYKVSPSPQSAFLIGKMLLQRKNYREALGYLLKAASLKDTSSLKEDYMYTAQTYRMLKNYPKAREMALKAIRLDPHDGLAYEFIGDLYAASATKCGTNALTKKVAFWAAVDQFEKAKRVSPDLAASLNKKIAIYKANFPTRETMFFYNIKPGDKYKVGCWINVTTIARASN